MGHAMIYLVKLLYIWLLPPGLFVVVCFVSAWYWRREKAIRRFALAMGTLIWILAMPFFSDWAMRLLENQYASPQPVTGDVVVLLAGGIVTGYPDVEGMNTLNATMSNRTLTAIRLAKNYNLPLLYSGGSLLSRDGDQATVVKRIAISLGVPQEKFFVESKSLNTTQSVRLMMPIISEKAWHQPIVVTSASHMFRSVQIFRLAGIQVQPWPCDYRVSQTQTVSYVDFLPTAGSLENFSVLMRELLGSLSLYTAYVDW